MSQPIPPPANGKSRPSAPIPFWTVRDFLDTIFGIVLAYGFLKFAELVGVLWGDYRHVDWDFYVHGKLYTVYTLATLLIIIAMLIDDYIRSRIITYLAPCRSVERIGVEIAVAFLFGVSFKACAQASHWGLVILSLAVLFRSFWALKAKKEAREWKVAKIPKTDTIDPEHISILSMLEALLSRVPPDVSGTGQEPEDQKEPTENHDKTMPPQDVTIPRHMKSAILRYWHRVLDDISYRRRLRYIARINLGWAGGIMAVAVALYFLRDNYSNTDWWWLSPVSLLGMMLYIEGRRYAREFAIACESSTRTGLLDYKPLKTVFWMPPQLREVLAGWGCNLAIKALKDEGVEIKKEDLIRPDI